MLPHTLCVKTSRLFAVVEVQVTEKNPSGEVRRHPNFRLDVNRRLMATNLIVTDLLIAHAHFVPGLVLVPRHQPANAACRIASVAH